MTESRDPGYIDENTQGGNALGERLDRQMNEDLNFVCSVLAEAEIEKTAENMFRYQTSRQYMQYSTREIRRWLQGVK